MRTHPIPEQLARLHTRQAWNAFQAYERKRQTCFRLVALLIAILTAVIWLGSSL